MIIPTELHYYRCSNCATVLIVAVKTPTGYEGCNGCRSYMKFLFTQPVETHEDRDAAALVASKGRVYRHSPSADPLKYTPVQSYRDPVTLEEGRRRHAEHMEKMRRLEEEQDARRRAMWEEMEADSARRV